MQARQARTPPWLWINKSTKSSGFTLSSEHREAWPGKVAVVVGGSSDIKEIRRSCRKQLRDIGVRIEQYHAQLFMDKRVPQGRFLLLITEALFSKDQAHLRSSLDAVFDTCECHRMRQKALQGYGWCDVLTTLSITQNMCTRRRGLLPGTKYITKETDLPRENGKEMTGQEKRRCVPFRFINFPLPDVHLSRSKLQSMLQNGSTHTRDDSPHWKEDANLSFNDLPLGHLLEQALDGSMRDGQRLALVLLVCAAQLSCSGAYASIFQSERHLLGTRQRVLELTEKACFLRAFLSSGGTTSVEIGLVSLCLQSMTSINDIGALDRCMGSELGIYSAGLLERCMMDMTVIDNIETVDGHSFAHFRKLMPANAEEPVAVLLDHLRRLMLHFLQFVLQKLDTWHELMEVPERRCRPSIIDGVAQSIHGHELASFLSEKIRLAATRRLGTGNEPAIFEFPLELQTDGSDDSSDGHIEDPEDIGNFRFEHLPSPIEQGKGTALKMRRFTYEMQEVFDGYQCHPREWDDFGSAIFNSAGARQGDCYLLVACLDIYLHLVVYDDKKLAEDSDDERDHREPLQHNVNYVRPEHNDRLEFEFSKPRDPIKVCFAARPQWLLNPRTNPPLEGDVDLALEDGSAACASGTAGAMRQHSVFVLKRHMIPDTMFLSAALIAQR